MNSDLFVTDRLPQLKENLHRLYESCGAHNSIARLKENNVPMVEAAIHIAIAEALQKGWNPGSTLDEIANLKAVRPVPDVIKGRMVMVIALLSIFRHQWGRWGSKDLLFLAITFSTHLTIVPLDEWVDPENVAMISSSTPDHLTTNFVSMVCMASAMVSDFPFSIPPIISRNADAPPTERALIGKDRKD